MIAMIGAEQSCVDVARQWHAVKQAVGAAKNLHRHDHPDYGPEGIAEHRLAVLQACNLA